MSQEEKANSWKKREQQASLADDQRNCFTIQDATRIAKRADTTAHDQRVKGHDDQHRIWTHQTDAPTTTSGVKLDPETARLKAAADADRLRAKQPPRVIHLSALYACTRVWRLETEHGQGFFDDDFNWQSLNNAIQTRLGNGGDVSIETIEGGYQDALAGNHLMLPYTRDSVTGGRVTPRGAKPITPPTMFPAYHWPDEVAIAEREAEEARHQANSQEAQRALAMTFGELRAEVRRGFKSTAAGITNVGERIR